MQTLRRIQIEQVYVSEQHPLGLTLAEFRALPCKQRRERTWRPMVRFAPADLHAVNHQPELRQTVES
jgi:hypothetical protein